MIRKYLPQLFWGVALIAILVFGIFSITHRPTDVPQDEGLREPLSLEWMIADGIGENVNDQGENPTNKVAAIRKTSFTTDIV